MRSFLEVPNDGDDEEDDDDEQEQDDDECELLENKSPALVHRNQNTDTAALQCSSRFDARQDCVEIVIPPRQVY